MGNGLRDQLLKAGLVNEKQIKKANQEKRKEQKQGTANASNDERHRIQQAAAEKAERDRQLNLERSAEQERKAAAAQIRQLVDAHRQPTGDGELPYNFVDAGAVKRLYVSDEVRGKISRGALAIIRVEKEYALVPSEIAERIRIRSESAVVVLHAGKSEPDQRGSDDPYSAYSVPDDLMW